MQENKPGRQLTAGTILGGLLLGALAFFIFIGGAALGRTQGSTSVIEQIETRVEVPVTREVPLEVEVEVTRLVEVEVPVEVTPEPAEQEAAVAEPTAVPEEAPPSEIPLDSLDPEDLALLYEVWDIIKDDFDGDLPSREALNQAIVEGAIDALGDEYTRYVPPDVAARNREDLDGSFEGIGAFVRENDAGFVEIVRPIDGQPADLAGLRAGDLIIGINGEDVTGQSLDEVITKVRGPRGEEVILTIAREGEAEPLEIRIVRARIEIPTVEYELLDNRIAYVRLTSFNAVAEEQMVAALTELLDEKPRGLIFDLRDNPGGFLDSAVNVADLFLPESVVLYERNDSGLDRTFEVDSGDLAEEIPMVVLVNAGSASASELLAGAFRDNDRALLVGETTFGKGSVQQINTLDDGSELRVTIARWYTPSGANIDGVGLDPDIEVILPPEASLRGEDDVQLQQALEILTTGQ